MAAFTDAFENLILAHLFGATTFAPPGNYYIAAFNTSPSDTGGGSEVNILYPGAGYARIPLANNTGVFSTSGSQSSLLLAVAFPTATGSWGTVNAIGIMSSATLGAGTLYAYTTISPQIINAGDILRIPAGTSGLLITLD